MSSRVRSVSPPRLLDPLSSIQGPHRGGFGADAHDADRTVSTSRIVRAAVSRDRDCRATFLNHGENEMLMRATSFTRDDLSRAFDEFVAVNGSEKAVAALEEATGVRDSRSRS